MQSLDQNGITTSLRVGLSQKRGIKRSAPGVSLFAGGKSQKRKVAVFRKGDCVIPRISGTMAMRVQGPDGKFRDWLIDGNRFAGLGSDSHVIWSAVEVPVRRKDSKGKMVARKVELGCRPDDYAFYINHSSKPTVKVYSSFDDRLTKKQNVKYLSACPVTEDSVTHRVVADTDIYSDDEITWFYTANPDFSCSRYRRPFDSKTDSSLAKQTIVALTGQKLNELKEDSCTHLLEKRWQRKFKPATRHYKLTQSEIFLKEKYLKNGQFALKKALKACRCQGHKEEVMITYLKIRLRGCNDLIVAVENIRTVFRRESKANQQVSTRIRCTLTDIYQYCYEKGLINPEDEPYSVPLEWLANQIGKQSGEERARWYLLLVNRLRAVLVYPGCDRSTLITNLCTAGMPNPLREGRCEWKLYDLESLTGFIGYDEPDQKKVEKLINSYLQVVPKRACVEGKGIAVLAKRGQPSAIKAIVFRRLSGKTTKKELLKEFTKTGIGFVVGGKNCPADEKNLYKFVREHFSSSEREKIRGYWWCSDDELIESLSSQKKYATAVNSEICARIRAGNRQLLKPFIQKSVRPGETRRCSILGRLRETKIYDKGTIPFTEASVSALLTPEQQAYFAKTRKR
ncbi:hypothetical protein M3P05_15855 [Sansalvadorimonas sp. 2012CJ34-2]|uniref:Uncharacterized protein n=1 Tax=Parendozoicomonas callyspongiae TaxID=2942213 RepID=A0ABT0PJI6_9GAMM|nr:hypothetical protein [Sansalvadorimonas sp. 2012CJ34-2]MCL6271396.1 hypothetical protein [Sansalvadorimonas sp. 2012CJ34-2]